MRRDAALEFQDLATRLLALETGEDETPEGLAEGLQNVLRKLHGRMSRLLTAAGFEALLRRGLRLARASHPFLQTVEIQPESEDCLEGMVESVASLSLTEAREGLEAILANTFCVLAIFIGKDMTLRQLYRVWPEISPGETPSRPQEARE